MTIATIKARYTTVTKLDPTRENVITTFPYLANIDLNFSTRQAWDLVNQALDLIPEVIEFEESYADPDNKPSHNLQRSLQYVHNGKVSYIRDQSEIKIIEEKIGEIFSDLISEKNEKRDNANIHKFLLCENLPNVISQVEIITNGKINKNGRKKGFYTAQGKKKTLPKSCDNQTNMSLNQAKPDAIECVSIFDNDWQTLKHLIKLTVNGTVIYNIGEKLKQIEKDITKLESQAIEAEKRKVTARSKVIATENVIKHQKTIPMVLKLGKNQDSYLRRFAHGELLQGKIILGQNGNVLWQNAIGYTNPIKIGEVIRVKQDKLIWYDVTPNKYADLLNQNKINDCKVKLHSDYGYNAFGVIFRGYDALYNGKIIAKAKAKPYYVQKMIWLSKIEIIQSSIDCNYAIFRTLNDKEKQTHTYYVRHDITSDIRANQTIIANTVLSKLVDNLPNKVKQKDYNDFLRGLKKLLTYIRPTYSEKNLATVSYLLLDRFQGEARVALKYILPAVTFIKGKHSDNTTYKKLCQEIGSLI